MENIENFKMGLLARVNPFLNKYNAYSYIYNSQMSEIFINTDVPTYSIIKKKNSPYSYLQESYKTAFVQFDESGKNISFQFNKYFAETLNSEEIQFVFAHEALHVLLNHGKRGSDFINSLPKEKQSYGVLNKAMDVCINEILIDTCFKDSFKYMHRLKDSLCTIEIIFDRRGIVVEKDQNFEYYYMKILENMEDGDESDEYTMFGDIEAQSVVSKEIADKLEETAEKGGVTDENVKDKLSKKPGYTEDSGSTGFEKVVTQFKKMNLDDAITRYIKPRNMSSIDYKSAGKVSYNWYKDDRRFISMKKQGNILPNRSIKYKNKKMKVIIYCDVSGSVESYTKSFLSIIDRIDTSRVEVIPYVWADSVSLATKVGIDKFSWDRCGGGTNIVSVINHYTKEYPDDKVDSVVVLTDGEYRDITSTKLGRKFDHSKWCFFMTSSRRIDNVIDKSVSVEINW